VECQHALDNSVKRMTLGHFMRGFEAYLKGGRGGYLVDQKYLSAISSNRGASTPRGQEVRVHMVLDAPLEITVRAPAR